MGVRGRHSQPAKPDAAGGVNDSPELNTKLVRLGSKPQKTAKLPLRTVSG